MKNIFIISLALMLLAVSCTENTETNKKEKSVTATTEKLAQYQVKFDIEQPRLGLVITRGKSFLLKLNVFKDDRNIDSLQYLVNDNPYLLIGDSINTKNFKAGLNIIVVKAYNSDGSKDIQSTEVKVISDIKPEIKYPKLVKKYPHDVTAYTQGLIYINGFMYEGTGQYRESMLKKIDLSSNELIQSYNLPKEVFGEGIVEHNGKIYQLTWQSHRAFEYDLKTFNLIHEFQYDTEGWGITNYGDNLIMSDGTQNLFILDPESFATIGKLQVYDNVGPINNLNELEWINGKIWANVYLTNTIVIINPETGFVEQKLDLTNFVPDTYANPHDNVLNGIAYDQKANKIYVTGKRWPVLYEINIE